MEGSSEDHFHSVVLTLYRAQGRRWLGEYQPADQLCGVCFLKREQYLGQDGSAKTSRRGTPVPEGFFGNVQPRCSCDVLRRLPRPQIRTDDVDGMKKVISCSTNLSIHQTNIRLVVTVKWRRRYLTRSFAMTFSSTL